MLLRFIGTDWSLGLRNGTLYRVSVSPGNAVQPYIIMRAPVYCPYASDEAFWKNWAVPESQDQVDIRRKRIEALKDFAWKEGYDACKEGKQRHSPYDPRKN